VSSVLLLDLAVLVLLFLITGLFSAAETSLIALGRVRLAHAIEQGGKRGHALELWRKDPNRLLTTILILANATNIAASTVTAFLAVQLAEILHWSRAQLGTALAVLVTLIIILFSEVSPKLLAIRNAESIALALIRPLIFVDRIISPIGRLFVQIANLVLRFFGQTPGTHVPVITEEEIHTLIKMGADAGVIEDEEHRMLHGVISLGDMQVREVMVPRTSMECLNADDDMERIVDKILQGGYSRMPVYRSNFDNLIGLIYTKDIISILQNRELIVLQDILRQPYFVPETKKVGDLLREFQKGRIHMAIVVDEYGGTSGLVTLEDLIEVIVGEIHDEYDVEEKTIEKLDDQLWSVSGQTDIGDLNAFLDLNLPNVRDLNTVGGFLSDLFGHLPRKGEKIVFENVEFSIVSATNRRIDRVQVRVLPPVNTETEDGAE
jgi:CBS domain containing-hemolysin-like protein